MFQSIYVFPANPRNDKYSAKVKKYFVEYSDKESNKKTNTEIEKSKTRTEAPDTIYQTLLNIFVRCVCLQLYTQPREKKKPAGLSAAPGRWSAALQPVAAEATYGSCWGEGPEPPWGRSLSLTIRAPWWFSSYASYQGCKSKHTMFWVLLLMIIFMYVSILYQMWWGKWIRVVCLSCHIGACARTQRHTALIETGIQIYAFIKNQWIYIYICICTSIFNTNLHEGFSISIIVAFSNN